MTFIFSKIITIQIEKTQKNRKIHHIYNKQLTSILSFIQCYMYIPKTSKSYFPNISIPIRMKRERHLKKAKKANFHKVYPKYNTCAPKRRPSPRYISFTYRPEDYRFKCHPPQRTKELCHNFPCSTIVNFVEHSLALYIGRFFHFIFRVARVSPGAVPT